MSYTEHIEIDPKIMLGKPVIRGTRVTVELVLRKLSEGASDQDLLAAYPHLSRDDIRAALAYAADSSLAQLALHMAKDVRQIWSSGMIS